MNRDFGGFLGKALAHAHVEGDAGLGEHWENRASLFRSGWNTVLPAFAKFVQQLKPREE